MRALIVSCLLVLAWSRNADAQQATCKQHKDCPDDHDCVAGVCKYMKGDPDGDGILASDRCPNEPEDKDGFQDFDGCPDPDNDGDGIPDTLDQCMNEAETKNGFQDGDGCPDVLPGAKPILKRACPDRQVWNENAQKCMNRLDALMLDEKCAAGTQRDPSGRCRVVGAIAPRPCPAGTVRDVARNACVKVGAPAPIAVTRPPPEQPARPAPTGYRCGPQGKLILNKGCECGPGRVERRDADGASVCARTP